MSEIENHSLGKEFPQMLERIAQLRSEDPLFAEKVTEYHSLDHHVRGLQSRDIPVSDGRFMEMKKRRALLKDELYAVLLS